MNHRFVLMHSLNSVVVSPRSNMFILLLLSVASADVLHAEWSWPTCDNHECTIVRSYPRDGWNVTEYAVDGKRLTVSFWNGTLQWKCAPGTRGYNHRPMDIPQPMAVQALEFHCPLSHPNKRLLHLLNVNPAIAKLSISLNRNQRIQTYLLSSLSLTELSIHSEELVKLEGTSNLNSLKRLTLHKITIDREHFQNLRKIEELTLSEIGLEEVPDLGPFEKLKKLEIREPLLSNASWLVSAPALADLTLEAPDAAMVALPRLKKATFINVYAMERIFGNCSELEELSLLSGSLDRLREGWLVGCVNLRRLQLSWLSELRALPDNLLTDAFHLTELDLSHNALSALPEHLLTRQLDLTHLDLSYNQLKVLPESLLTNKPKLVYLDISNNAIWFLPEWLVNNFKIFSPEKHCDLLNISNNSFIMRDVNQLKAEIDSLYSYCLIV